MNADFSWRWETNKQSPWTSITERAQKRSGKGWRLLSKGRQEDRRHREDE